MPVAPTIVCAVDRSPRAHHVAHMTGQLAEALGARVVLAHVFDRMMVPAPPTRELDRVLSTENIEEYERRLARQALARTVEFVEDVACATVFAEGQREPELLGVVEDYDGLLLVAGSAALKPLARVMGGSLAGRLAVVAPCPVVVVTDDTELRDTGPVLVAYDGSEHSLRAARHGAALATRLGRELVLMHVAAPGEPGLQADEQLARELHVAVAVEYGDPAERLALAATERAASLIVVGSRGRNELHAALLGSVSAGVVRLADRPVVVVGPNTDARLPARAT